MVLVKLDIKVVNNFQQLTIDQIPHHTHKGLNVNVSKKIDRPFIKVRQEVFFDRIEIFNTYNTKLQQDLYMLFNSETSLWLIEITDINKPFGLELLKSILVRYTEIFKKLPEMCFILKERVCPLLIKLFSPSTKLKINSSIQSNLSISQSMNQSTQSGDQKSVEYFSIVSRLIRIVFVLIQLYFELLITESEIFLSLRLYYA